jgi:apolipoprotein N-acyltransferase
LGAVSTGLLLAASFPPIAASEAAWLALVPLLVALRRRTAIDAFLLGFTAGAVFWLCSVAWITFVTIPGWLLLAGYCALYPALFAVGIARWLAWADGRDWPRNLLFLIFCPAWWVSLEFARSHVLTGFPWNTLGISQFDVGPLRQLARWGGVYAVSAVLVVFNASVASTGLRYLSGGARWLRTAHPELAVGFLVMAVSAVLGMQSMQRGFGAATAAHIAVIQPNIPQVYKWDDATVPTIYRRLRDLTEEALITEDLDLVIWPETALPDDVRYSEVSYGLVQDLVVDRVPLMVGSLDYVRGAGDEINYLNSSFLFDREGRIAASYDKQHLVLFGEYIPFSRWLSFLHAMTPIAVNITPGQRNVVFQLESPPIPFSALICFEDAFPYLGRRAVKEGARLLINQTNDAWFERSSASRQHMAHCVFRCVENQVPAVRAANTGVSCFIDAGGTVRSVLADDTGSTFVAGQGSDRVRVPRFDRPPTFYTRHGDVFAWSGVVIAVLFMAGHFGTRLVRSRGS